MCAVHKEVLWYGSFLNDWIPSARIHLPAEGGAMTHNMAGRGEVGVEVEEDLSHLVCPFRQTPLLFSFLSHYKRQPTKTNHKATLCCFEEQYCCPTSQEKIPRTPEPKHLRKHGEINPIQIKA